MTEPVDDLRADFTKEMRRRFRRLRGKIRKWVGYEHDVFGLATDGGTPPAELPDDAPDVSPLSTDAVQTAAFLAWLRGELETDVLEPMDMSLVERGDHWTAEFIRAAYVRGWRQARNRLRTQGVSVGSLPGDDDTELIEALFDMPASRRGLQTLYTETYEDLQGVGADTAQPVRETLVEGFEKGWNPRKTANKLTREVRTIQHTQAEVLTRTKTMEAYSEGTLDRYERAGVDTVRHGEWSDAGDTRVCPICETLDGREIPIGEIRSGTFTFEPDAHEPDHLAGEYPLLPPAHPSCRCIIQPVII
jgi:SPP1 gp7 family putative phage head morphogenesis protein